MQKEETAEVLETLEFFKKFAYSKNRKSNLDWKNYNWKCCERKDCLWKF